MKLMKFVVTCITAFICCFISANSLAIDGTQQRIWSAAGDNGYPIRIFPDKGNCWKGKNSLSGTVSGPDPTNVIPNVYTACFVPKGSSYEVYVQGKGYIGNIAKSDFTEQIVGQSAKQIKAIKDESDTKKRILEKVEEYNSKLANGTSTDNDRAEYLALKNEWLSKKYSKREFEDQDNYWNKRFKESKEYFDNKNRKMLTDISEIKSLAEECKLSTDQNACLGQLDYKKRGFQAVYGMPYEQALEKYKNQL